MNADTFLPHQASETHLISSGHSHRRTAAFTLMETVVVAAIIIVIGAIAIPVYTAIRQRAHKQSVTERMRTLGGAVATYTSQNNGLLPEEDAPGEDTWENSAKPEAKDAWYNALPRLIGRKGAGDYAASPRDFYTEENLLFVPGADYPGSDKKLRYPLFAIAYNTKLHRKDSEGRKARVKVNDVAIPSKTVVLLEQGLPGEKLTLEIQSKKDYDGSPKGSAKSFVGRYGGKGVLFFLDGHAELVAAKELLTEIARFPYPQTEVIWTPTPEEDPNK